MGKKYLTLLVIISIVIFSISCQVLSFLQKATPTPTEVPATATPRPTRTPLPTKTPEPTATSEMVVFDDFFYDDFSYDSGAWPMGYYPGDFGNVTYEIKDGVFEWTLESIDGVNQRAWPDFGSVMNFNAIVDGRQTQGDLDECDYGILYRQDSDKTFLSFTVSNQDFSIYSHTEADGWVEMVPWTNSNDIFPNSFNKLEVVRDGFNYTFYINDRYMADVDFFDISDAQVGLNADVFDGGYTCVFEFDNFEITSYGGY